MEQTRYRVEAYVATNNLGSRPYAYYDTMAEATQAFKDYSRYGIAGITYPDTKTVDGVVIKGEPFVTHWPPSQILYLICRPTDIPI